MALPNISWLVALGTGTAGNSSQSAPVAAKNAGLHAEVATPSNDVWFSTLNVAFIAAVNVATPNAMALGSRCFAGEPFTGSGY